MYPTPSKIAVFIPVKGMPASSDESGDIGRDIAGLGHDVECRLVDTL
jgi:hypothetical protein